MNYHKDISFLQSQCDLIPTKKPIDKISDYVEGHRLLPPGTPFPGLWRNAKTPYGVEIMDNMRPDSKIIRTVVMKGAQLGLTACADNVVAYYMDEVPSEIMFITASDDLIKTWTRTNLEPLIDSCGFRHKIRSNSEKKNNRRQGDTMYSKEYIGGSLSLASAQSASSLRSASKQILIRDEIDGAPSQLRTGEGSWLDVSEARTNAWGSRKRILDFSTPATYESSLVFPAYEDGDKRKYFVPCPHCKKLQVLKFDNLQPKIIAGVLDSVFYQCEKCDGAIYNYHKNEMLSNGNWIPTSKSISNSYRSYQISSLYSPLGMMSWKELYQKYLSVKDDPNRMRAFINLYLGEPFREIGSRPDLKIVMELRGSYLRGTVPDDVLFLTASVDVQRGSKTDKENPARLEMEICGHGRKFKTFSIDYKVFTGDINSHYAGAWEKLRDFIENEFKFSRHDGKQFTPLIVLIDSGDGMYTNVVYEFCEPMRNVYPLKGFSAFKKKENGDALGRDIYTKYKIKKLVGSNVLYEISTNYYKRHLYNNLKRARIDIGNTPAGFCDFPSDYPDKYFKMLTAEEQRRDGSFHCPSGRRNESLDLRVYNLCACDVFLNGQVKRYKDIFKDKGATPQQLETVNYEYIFGLLEKGAKK